MSLHDLYMLCDNLGSHSFFEVRSVDPYGGPGKLLDSGTYTDIYFEWCDYTVKGFRVADDGCKCIIHV